MTDINHEDDFTKSPTQVSAQSFTSGARDYAELQGCPLSFMANTLRCYEAL